MPKVRSQYAAQTLGGQGASSIQRGLSKAPIEEEGSACKAMYFCESLDQWLAPEASDYRGLCVSRHIDRTHYQEAVDAFLEACGHKDEGGHLDLGVCVDIKNLRGRPGALRVEATKKAAELLHGLDLPHDLKDMIKCDAADLFDALSKLLPTAEHMHLKLESFGVHGRCAIWHRDNYMARAITCYCGAGTEHVEDSNFDFPLWTHLLQKRGLREEDNWDLVKDQNEVKSIECGNILLIKGKEYPHHSRGLVHKSPEPEFYSDGREKARLCLKVDIGHRH